MKVLGFEGGVHPPERKDATERFPIGALPAPELLTVPLSQHIGAAATPAVEKGESVKKGQVIGDAAGFVSANVHSPVSGKVTKLTTCLHPLGMKVGAVEIENDGKEEWADGADAARADIDGLSPDDIKKIIQEAGIVGMGGATFPTHVKLSPPQTKPIDSCILNGAECEPYLTADHRLMLEEPERVVKGFLWILRALGEVRGYIAVEANKREAYEKMRSAAREIAPEVTCVLMPVKYPQGAEKQLIKSLLDRDVPPQTERGLPMDVGCVVQNVGTAAAVYDAVERNIPSVERVTTVTGDAVSKPANLRVKVGTGVSEILSSRGADGYGKLIMGGPMMGIAVPTAELPVNKGTSGILALREGAAVEELPCIRCGRCVEACPMNLVPSYYGVLGKAGMLEEMERWHVVDCIECGSCAYVCPSKIHLVHYAKLGKHSAAARARARAAK